MNIYLLIDLFAKYGLYLLFIIVFLEYMNLPGLPSGIIMPAAGILVQESEMSFFMAFIISVIAGLLGSYVLYAIGYFLGKPLLNKYYTKYKRLQKPIDRALAFTEKHGNKGIFFARLIPVARTIVSLTAGIFRMNIWAFSFYSVIGIAFWNIAYIYAGYAFGYYFLK